jgi:hypothetical protein
MNLQLLSFLLGALLLLVGILGGGFDIKEVKIPKVGTLPRMGAFAAGVFFLYVGFVGHDAVLGTRETADHTRPETSQPAGADQANGASDRPPEPALVDVPMKPGNADTHNASPNQAVEPPREPAGNPAADLFQAFLSAIGPTGPGHPLGDSRIQRAVELAVNRQDIAMARQLLAEAGYPDGFAVQLRMSRLRQAGAVERDVDMLSRRLIAVGVRVEITPD